MAPVLTFAATSAQSRPAFARFFSPGYHLAAFFYLYTNAATL
jgi:hypothetical protein